MYASPLQSLPGTLCSGRIQCSLLSFRTTPPKPLTDLVSIPAYPSLSYWKCFTVRRCLTTQWFLNCALWNLGAGVVVVVVVVVLLSSLRAFLPKDWRRRQNGQGSKPSTPPSISVALLLIVLDTAFWMWFHLKKKRSLAKIDREDWKKRRKKKGRKGGRERGKEAGRKASFFFFYG